MQHFFYRITNCIDVSSTDSYLLAGFQPQNYYQCMAQAVKGNISQLFVCPILSSGAGHHPLGSATNLWMCGTSSPGSCPSDFFSGQNHPLRLATNLWNQLSMQHSVSYFLSPKGKKHTPWLATYMWHQLSRHLSVSCSLGPTTNDLRYQHLCQLRQSS